MSIKSIHATPDYRRGFITGKNEIPTFGQGNIPFIDEL
jgi:hypothetical protein